jgi:CCR4-NOT transcription complex subunit 4
MEALDYDDLGFYPCGCGYQVCRFCWNRLKNDENGLCPACRQPYPDSPIQFSTISIEAVEELKKKKKKQKEKQKLKDGLH